MSNYTRWYTTGSANATNGSKTVTGTGTYWKTAGLNPGDLLTFDGGNSFKEIASVNSDTSITLAANYTGTTVTGADYAIVRNFTATTPSKVAAQLAELLGDFQRYIDTDMQKLNGKSAYEIAKENGYTGTEAQWLESLKGAGEIPALKARADAIEGKTNALDGLGRNSLVMQNLSLGGSFTDEQKTAISSGTFSNMWLGSRWLIPGTSIYFRIIGFNHFNMVQSLVGNWESINNHIVVEVYAWKDSDANLVNRAPFHTSDDLSGGLHNYSIYKTNMMAALAKAESFFGSDHIQPMQALVCDAWDMTNGATHYAVSKDKIFMFTPSQILGGVPVAENTLLYKNMRRQFPLFRYAMPQQSDNQNAIAFWCAGIPLGKKNPYTMVRNYDEVDETGYYNMNMFCKFYLLIK